MAMQNDIVEVASKFGMDLKQGSSQRGLLWIVIAQGFVTLPPEHMKWFIWASFMLVGALGLFRKDEISVHPEVEKVLTDAVPSLSDASKSIDDIINEGQKP